MCILFSDTYNRNAVRGKCNSCEGCGMYCLYRGDIVGVRRRRRLWSECRKQTQFSTVLAANESVVARDEICNTN